MELTFNRLFTYLIPYLLGGISVTLSVSFLALVIGAVGGLLLAFLRVYGGRAVQVLMTIFSAVFRAIPQTILLLLLYFVIAGSINISAYWAGTLSLAVISCVYQLEIFRSAIESVDYGQMMAARAIGMSHLKAVFYIILPQALRNIIPQIGNNFIINIKDTSVLSVISITDLFFVHKSVVGALYTYFESAAIVMVIYLTMTLFASYLLRLWEKALDGPQNYDLNTTDSLAYTSGMYNAPDPNHESQNLDMKGSAAHV